MCAPSPSPPAFPLAPLAFLFVGLGLFACSANSTGRYRGQALGEGDPWSTLRRAWESGGEIKGSELRAGLQQLEDLVEHAASVVLACDVDFPTPGLFEEDRIVSVVDRRDTVARARETRLVDWLDNADRWGLKYLFDHLGAGDLADIEPAQRGAVLALCQGVGQFVRGNADPASARARVRRLEAPAFRALGLSEAAAAANAVRFDASIWRRCAFTDPGPDPSDPFGPRVYLSLETLRAPGAEPAFTYAHELFHALVLSRAVPGGWEGAGSWSEATWSGKAAPEERVVLHELSAQVFAKRVLDQLASSGAMGGGDPVDLLALEGVADPGSDERARRRLFSLYRRAPGEGIAEARIQKRYGYGTSAEELLRLDALMERIGPRRFLERLVSLGHPGDR